MNMQNNMSIYFAPLQEFTDSTYRNAYNKYFSGVYKYFTPYLQVVKEFSVKSSHLKEVMPENNSVPYLVPQILAGTPGEFTYLAKLLCEFGYKEINWNLGCPYPMVTKKGRGSGLLTTPGRIEDILEEAFSTLDCRISVKARLGLESDEDIFKVLEILNKFPLEEVIVHPRTARQLYRGTPDNESFARVAGLLKQELVYNGDIVDKQTFKLAKERFPGIKRWMIGRGILSNPWLPAIINGEQLPELKEQIEVLQSFHGEIFHSYSGKLSGRSHLLTRMLKFWTYFCHNFPEPRKALKRIKKAGTLDKYELAVRENFSTLEL